MTYVLKLYVNIYLFILYYTYYIKRLFGIFLVITDIKLYYNVSMIFNKFKREVLKIIIEVLLILSVCGTTNKIPQTSLKCI